MTSASRTDVLRVGFWAAVLTALLTALAFAIAVATPPRSGPSCVFPSCVGYPYTEIQDFFPRDYFWMAPAVASAFAFLALTVASHYSAPSEKRVFTLLGLLLATMATASLGLDYFVQLTVVQPSILRGEVDGLSLISQYNPHGLFTALEAFGYLVMSGALACCASAFAGAAGASRIVRWTFRAAFVLSLAALTILVAIYGHDLEYRFEIAAITINWTALIVGGSAAAVHFRRDLRGGGGPQ